jgi:hypothetical protein
LADFSRPSNKVAAGCRTLGLRAAIVFQLEECWLPALLGVPGFKLRAAQFQKALRTIRSVTF